MHTHTCAHSTPLHASANRTELQRHPPDSRVLSFHVLFLQSPRRQSSVQCRSGSGGQHGGCGEGSHRACFLPETIYRCGFKARTYAHTHTHTHTHQFFVKTLPCNYTYTAHARIKPEQLLARCTRDGGTRMGMSTTHSGGVVPTHASPWFTRLKFFFVRNQKGLGFPNFPHAGTTR